MSRRINQVTLRDIFTSNTGELLGSGGSRHGAGGSSDSGTGLDCSQASQFPQSQMDWCTDSQSNLHQLSQEQSSQSSGSQFVGRYGSRGTSMFNSQPQLRVTAPQPAVAARPTVTVLGSTPSRQHVELCKTKALELDRRDLLQNLMLSIRDCSSEVKTAVSSLKESVQLHLTSTESNWTQFQQQIEAKLDTGHSAVVALLQARVADDNLKADLVKQLAAKDEQIAALEAKIAKLVSNSESVVLKELRQLSSEQREQLVATSAQLHAELAAQIGRCNSDEAAKTRDFTAQLIKDSTGCIESRLQADVQSREATFRQQTAQVESNLQRLLSSLDEKLRSEIERLMLCQTNSVTDLWRLRRSELLDEQRQQLKELISGLTHQLESCLHQQSIEQRNNIVSDITGLYNNNNNNNNIILPPVTTTMDHTEDNTALVISLSVSDQAAAPQSTCERLVQQTTATHAGPGETTVTALRPGLDDFTSNRSTFDAPLQQTAVQMADQRDVREIFRQVTNAGVAGGSFPQRNPAVERMDGASWDSDGGQEPSQNGSGAPGVSNSGLVIGSVRGCSNALAAVKRNVMMTSAEHRTDVRDNSSLEASVQPRPVTITSIAPVMSVETRVNLADQLTGDGLDQLAQSRTVLSDSARQTPSFLAQEPTLNAAAGADSVQGRSQHSSVIKYVRHAAQSWNVLPENNVSLLASSTKSSNSVIVEVPAPGVISSFRSTPLSGSRFITSSASTGSATTRPSYTTPMVRFVQRPGPYIGSALNGRCVILSNGVLEPSPVATVLPQVQRLTNQSSAASTPVGSTSRDAAERSLLVEKLGKAIQEKKCRRKRRSVFARPKSKRSNNAANRSPIEEKIGQTSSDLPTESTFRRKPGRPKRQTDTVTEPTRMLPSGRQIVPYKITPSKAVTSVAASLQRKQVAPSSGSSATVFDFSDDDNEYDGSSIVKLIGHRQPRNEKAVNSQIVPSISCGDIFDFLSDSDDCKEDEAEKTTVIESGRLPRDPKQRAPTGWSSRTSVSSMRKTTKSLGNLNLNSSGLRDQVTVDDVVYIVSSSSAESSPCLSVYDAVKKLSKR